MNSSIIRTIALVAANGLYEPTSSGGGGGGITQLTGDVLAGPAVGSTPATVVRVNGATVPAAGALTTGNVLQVTGVSALGYGPVNLALPAAVTGLLPAANIAPGANTQVLTTTAGVAVWAAAGGGGGITQLTGDVLAGPGAGSQAATVVQLTGAAGVVAVPTASLNFGAVSSTSGKLNFPSASATLIAYRNAANTLDFNAVAIDGSDNITFGSSGHFVATTLQGYFSVTLTQNSAGNFMQMVAAGTTFDCTKMTFASTPTYFDAGSNVTIGGTTPDFGGGVGGILAFAPFTTPPTTAPATNGLLGVGPTGVLHWIAPNATPAYFADYVLGPIWQGANNTQASVKQEYAGEGRGVGAGNTTLLTVPVPAGKVITIRVLATARDVAGGTVGDGFSADTILQFQNVGGVVTQATSLATPLTASSASLVGVLSVTGIVSGASALVNGAATVAAAGLTIDWTAIATVIVD